MPKNISAATVHVALTAPEAAALAALARDRRTSQRQVMRDALTLLQAQQPTASTAAATIDASLQRLADRLDAHLDARLDAALDGAVTHIVAQWRQDLTALAKMLPHATPIAATATARPARPPDGGGGAVAVATRPVTTASPAAGGSMFAPPIDPAPLAKRDGR
ncbi:MAG: hypothetical protein ACYCUI_09555 [Vulcanimicrobiaceae bacterium]